MKRTILLVFLLLLAASLSAEVLPTGHGPAGLAVNINGRVSSNAPFAFTSTPAEVASSPTPNPPGPLPIAPTITSFAATTFTVGSPGSFLVTTSGVPTPVMSEWGILPLGVTFTDNGNGTATLAGTPAAGTDGDYSIFFTAANGTLPNGVQAFTLHVIPAPPAPPLITSDNNTTFTVGAFGSFTVTTTGSPIPTISRTGALPGGVTFLDNGNGTATLSGTPAVGSQGSYPFIIRASNGLSPDGVQAFALKVKSIPAIVVIPQMNFSYTIGGVIPPAQTLGISSSGTDLSYTVQGDQPWLSVSPSSGTTPGNISVTVIPGNLGVGVYTGKITITAPGAENSPIAVGVTLTISPGPQLIIGPTVLPFAFTIGGSVPPPRTISVTTSGSNVAFTVSTDQPWLVATPTNGNTPSNITISVVPGPLGVGVYNGTVTISSAAASNSPQTAAVTLTVTNPPSSALGVLPTALTYNYTIGDITPPAAQTVNITSSDAPLTYTISTDMHWLSATPSGGTTPGSISVSVDPSGLSVGPYDGTVTVSSPAASNSPRTVTVHLDVKTGPTPTFVAGFDFRLTQNFVTDQAPNTYVLGPNTLYPTTRGGATFGWMDGVATGWDRVNYVDSRLAGVNTVRNDISPGVFRIDLPGPGTYTIAVALGDEYYSQCWTTCRIEFKDGSASLFSLNFGVVAGGDFQDANGILWSAQQWPTSNTTRDVRISGSSLSVLVGANNNGFGTQTPIAFIGVKSAQHSDTADFTLSASPTTLTVSPGNSVTSTITTTVLNGFNQNVLFSASGMPSGVTASFNPNPILGPGAGSSVLTFTAAPGASGSSAVTITAAGGTITHTTNVNVSASSIPIKQFAIGFDMRSTSNYVSDGATNTYVLGSQTSYPTTRNGATFGWLSGAPSTEDSTNLGDSRLAGVNLLPNDDSPSIFRLDLPGPGTYKVSLAMGDRYLDQCSAGCRIEFRDGNNSLFVLNQGPLSASSFADSNGKVWAASEWPSYNTTRQITMTGSILTVFVGTNSRDHSHTPIAFIGVAK